MDLTSEMLHDAVCNVDAEIRDLTKELHEAEKEMRSTRAKYHEISEEIVKLQQKKLSCLVGRAFKSKYCNEYFIITDVPQYSRIKNGDISFNPYQIPVMFVGNHATHKGEIYIGKDTVFSDAVDRDDVLTAFMSNKYKEYEEISRDEFYLAACKLITERIDNIERR